MSHKVVQVAASFVPNVPAGSCIQGGPKKWGHGLMPIILSNLNRFKKKFTGRFLGKFAVKRILKIPPHLAHVATLPCETLMSAKQGILTTNYEVV